MDSKIPQSTALTERQSQELAELARLSSEEILLKIEVLVDFIEARLGSDLAEHWSSEKILEHLAESEELFCLKHATAARLSVYLQAPFGLSSSITQLKSYLRSYSLADFYRYIAAAAGQSALFVERWRFSYRLALTPKSFNHRLLSIIEKSKGRHTFTAAFLVSDLGLDFESFSRDHYDALSELRVLRSVGDPLVNQKYPDLAPHHEELKAIGEVAWLGSIVR